MLARSSLRIAVLYQLGLLALAAGAVAIFDQPSSVSNLLEILSSRFTLWDGQHYLFLSQRGYVTEGDPANFIVFFPFYPGLIRAFTWIFRDPLFSGWLLSSLASVGAHALFIELLKETDISRSTRNRSLTLLLITPISIYFTMIYSESVYFLLSVSFFLALNRRRFSLAVFIGALCALTRPVGIAFILPYWIEIFRSRGELSGRQRVFLAFQGLLILSGFLVYLGINQHLFHDAFHYQSVMKSHWHKEVANPLINYFDQVTDLIRNPRQELNTFLIDRISVIIFPWILLSHLIFATKRIPTAWTAWAFLQWLIICSQTFWLSSARYIALIFPIYVALSDPMGRKRSAFILISIVFAAGMLQAVFIFSRGGWLY